MIVRRTSIVVSKSTSFGALSQSETRGILSFHSLVRTIHLQSTNKYIELTAAFSKLKNEGIDEKHSEIIYSNKHFVTGVKLLIEKDFSRALSSFQTVRDEMLASNYGHPDILATISKRLAICQLNLADNPGLLSSLKEVFLVRISDPYKNTFQIFTAVLNLSIYYSRHDLGEGQKFVDSYEELMEGIYLPRIMDHDIKLVFAVDWTLTRPSS